MARTQVQSELIATNAISGTIIADNAITATHIATNAISGTLVQSSGITTDMIASNNVTAAKIVSDGIETRHLHSNVISGQSSVTAASGDYVLIGDTSDSNNLKKALVSDFGVSGISSSADATAITIGSDESVTFAAGITSTAAANTLGATSFSEADLTPYLDTYTAAMNPAIRQIQEQTALGQQAARDRAATAGAFGGSRLGLMEATLGAEGIESEADLLAQAGADALGFAAGRFDTDRSARFDADAALRSAYETDEASRLKEIQAIQDAATTQENLKNQVAQGLITVGEAERLLDQRSADMGYSDYLDQRSKPYDDLNFLLGLASGVPYDTSTYTSGFREERGQAPSVYSQLLSGLGSLGSAYALANR